MVTRRGFTIIELMVVIVVISILARVVFVAFNNVQARTRDGIRKNDIAALAKQIQIYAVQNKTWTPTCGDTTNTMSGYTNVTYGTNPTITSCLKTFDNTNKQLNDPSNCVSMALDQTTIPGGASCQAAIRGAYMAYNTFTANGHYYLVARMETIGANQSAIDDSDMLQATKDHAKARGFNYVLKVR